MSWLSPTTHMGLDQVDLATLLLGKWKHIGRECNGLLSSISKVISIMLIIKYGLVSWKKESMKEGSQNSSKV